MKNLLIWEPTETTYELSPNKRSKSPYTEEKNSPYYFENKKLNLRNNLRK